MNAGWNSDVSLIDFVVGLLRDNALGGGIVKNICELGGGIVKTSANWWCCTWFPKLRRDAV
jgi:hypothetical protein